jgi:BirA family transcriptional regulator, biotin operon repressor / biotin---[acetyl-CoA-carboxylase] ligase
MVNIKSNTKQKILNQLKESPSWLSGEEISLNIGVSRVAVWKQIKSLQEQGYPVESSSRGYRIAADGDFLTDLEFSTDKDILFFNELNSTMDEAVRQIGLQPQESRAFTILAEHQSAGINRADGLWDSPSGGIYMTFVLRDSLALASVDIMKKKGILTALETLSTLQGIQKGLLSFSEEGELFLKDRKIGGLLEEYQVRGEKLLWYALGLGIHLNDSPPLPLTSIKMHCGREQNRVSVIKEIKMIWESFRTTDNNEIIDKLENNYVKR